MKLTSENKAKLTVKYNGTNVVISDGTDTFTKAVSARNFTMSKIMGNGVHDDLDGKLFNFKIWSGGDRNTGTLVCDLVGKDDAPLDLTGTHTFTETLDVSGSIVYEDKPKSLPSEALNMFSDYLGGAKEIRFWNKALDEDEINQHVYNYNDRIVNKQSISLVQIK